MREERIKKEYAKPTVEMVVFNYAEVMAASGVISNFVFGADDDGISQSLEVPVDNWISPDEVTDNTSDSNNSDAEAESLSE